MLYGGLIHGCNYNKATAMPMAIRIIAVVLVVISTYFYGVHQGKNSEELKNARSQISNLERTIQEYETKQKDNLIAMARLRVSESAARADAERVRDRVTALEKRAKTAESKLTIQCLRLEQEGRQLLREARGAIEFCGKVLQ